MKAIIFTHNNSRSRIYRWLLHINEIEKITTNEFYSSYNITYVKTKTRLFIINDFDKGDFYRRILDFEDSDKSYEVFRISKVRDEETELEFELEDWINQAIGES